MKFLLQTYVRLLIFAAALLLGIQIPSFIDQYGQRVDAHYREVSVNISGFQNTADLLFGGDLQQLIAYYANSNDTVFERDANSIQLIADRYARFAAEQAALADNLLAVAVHVLLAPDQEIFDETMAQYSYTVPLNSLAIQWGLALAIALILFLDFSLFGCRKCYGYLRRRKQRKLIRR